MAAMLEFVVQHLLDCLLGTGVTVSPSSYDVAPL